MAGQQLEQQLWSIANTLRGKMGADEVKAEALETLDSRLSILKAREIGDRIIARMKEFVDVFVRGVAV